MAGVKILFKGGFPALLTVSWHIQNQDGRLAITEGDGCGSLVPLNGPFIIVEIDQFLSRRYGDFLFGHNAPGPNIHDVKNVIFL